MAEIADRITLVPEQCGGRPCIRGMRIRVTDVLEFLASGLSQNRYSIKMPALKAEDTQACLSLPPFIFSLGAP